MITFSEEHSEAWIELVTAYQEFIGKIFNWAREKDSIKYQDLFMELGAPVNSKERDLHRRLLVTDLLRDTAMWDEKAILLASRELTEVALKEQEEVACYARMALKKIKHRSERLAIADQVFALAEAEEKEETPDNGVFYCGCMLLYELECKDHFSLFIERYSDSIYMSCGLDKNDLEDMGDSLTAKAAIS